MSENETEYNLPMDQWEYTTVSYAIKIMLAEAEKAELKPQCHKILSTAMVLKHRLCEMGRKTDVVVSSGITLGGIDVHSD